MNDLSFFFGGIVASLRYHLEPKLLGDLRSVFVSAIIVFIIVGASLLIMIIALITTLS